MTKEISENTKVQLSFKTFGTIIAIVAGFIGMYYSLSMEIQSAKELPIVEIPEPEITATEFQLKIDLITQTVMNNAEALEKIETQVEKIEERVYELK
jgi:xanthine/uracil permease